MQFIFSGLHDVQANDIDTLNLGNGFSLVKPNGYLLSAMDAEWMTGSEMREAPTFSRYLVYRHKSSINGKILFRCRTNEELKRVFLNGLMALQVLKPIKTQGLLFFGQFYDENPSPDATLYLTSRERRPPIVPGAWALKRSFDQEYLDRVPTTIDGILKLTGGPSAEIKNAFTLLQLGLEHFHPLIAGLLWVMGMEAIFNSSSNEDFQKKLCENLGALSPVFPDWSLPQPTDTVSNIAAHLHVLRSKLAHGVDLREAKTRGKYLVDLLEAVQVSAYGDSVTKAEYLSEIACYLLCRVLQKQLEVSKSLTESPRTPCGESR